MPLDHFLNQDSSLMQKRANLKILKWSKKNIKKPIVVIGGINNLNYKRLIKCWEQNILQYQVLFGITQN